VSGGGQAAGDKPPPYRTDGQTLHWQQEIPLLLSALEQRAAAYGPADDYWYTPRGVLAATGVRVDEQTALKISVFWRGVSIIAGSVAKLPLHVFERRADGGKQVAREHPLARVLRRPNERQNGFEWREQGQAHLLLRGNFYNRILPGSTVYPIGGLAPIHPDLVTVRWASNGNPVYEVRDAITGQKENLDREQIWHVHGLSLDGITGLDVITYAREALGLTVGAETFGARFLGQGAHFDKFLSHPGKISKEAATRLSTEAAALYGGLAHVGKVPVLQEGMTVQQLTLTHEQMQLLQTREYQASDCARWLGVPNHMVGLTTKSTSWGSGIEQMSIGFVVYTLFDWLRRWEASIGEDLIVTGVATGQPAMDLIVSNDDRFFAEFNVDGLLRGDTKTRHGAYQSGLLNRYYTRNEVRAMENLNPIPGGDIFDPPKGVAAPIGRGGGQAPALPDGARGSGMPDPYGNGRVPRGFIEDAAARVARKEQLAMVRARRRTADDGQAWENAVRGFYGEHPAYVSELLHVPMDRAEDYCRARVEELLTEETHLVENPMGLLVRLALRGSI